MVILKDGLICLANKNKNKKTTTVVVYKPKQQKQKQKKRPQRQRSSVPRGIMMPSCTSHFAKCIANPFAQDATGACVPAMNTNPSYKTHGFHNFNMVIGTGGVGYVVVSPCLSNNGASVYYTGATYAGTAGSSFSTAPTTGVVSNACTNLPYTAANLTQGLTIASRPAVNGRIVCAGLRWRYTGKETDRGGVEASYVDPQHFSIEAQTFNSLGTFPGLRIGQPNSNRDPGMMVITPVDSKEIEYPEVYNGSSANEAALLSCYPYSSGVGSAGNADFGTPMAVLVVTGAPGSTYWIEYVVHAEYQGLLTGPQATRNHVDEQGTNIVMSAAAAAQGQVGQTTTATWPAMFSRALQSEYAQSAIRMGRFALDSYLRSPNNPTRSRMRALDL